MRCENYQFMHLVLQDKMKKKGPGAKKNIIAEKSAAIICENIRRAIKSSERLKIALMIANVC